MRRRSAPGPTWLIGVVIAAVLAGGVMTVLTDDRTRPPVVETVIDDVEVLPEGQAEVTGTVTGFVADDAVGSPLTMPVEIDAGATATIEGAIVDGARSTIVWDGGRPFRLSGSGSIDLGPAHVEHVAGGVSWTLDGLRILTPGEYRLDTPVAVGSAGLAEPRDSIAFTADEETTIDAARGAVVGRGLPVHLEGPGSFRADGDFSIRTRDGTTSAAHLEFGPGSFVVDVEAGGNITAVFNGPLTSRR